MGGIVEFRITDSKLAFDFIWATTFILQPMRG